MLPPELAAAFSVTVGSQDTKRLKPHPAPVLFALETLGIRPIHAIMVGDTTLDVRSGNRAGTYTVGVLSGFGERGELGRVRPNLLLNSVADLAFLINTNKPQ